MPSEEKSQALITAIYNDVINMDEKSVVEHCHVILEEGIDPYEAIMKGLSAAMDKVGELYTNFEYFVPELLYNFSFHGNQIQINF